MRTRRALIILFVALGFSRAEAKSPLVMWTTLVLKDSKKPEDLKKVAALATQDHRLPGYMIPLEMKESNTTKEFLLVPALPACIHVPPPPPNQTVHVRMKTGQSAPVSWEPVWVEGRIVVKTSKNKEFGEASYEMEALNVKPLKVEDMNEINQAY